MHGIGDALSPGVLQWKPAVAVAGASASALLPPVGSIAMEPTSIEFAQIAHGGPRDEPGGENTSPTSPPQAIGSNRSGQSAVSPMGMLAFLALRRRKA